MVTDGVGTQRVSELLAAAVVLVRRVQTQQQTLAVMVALVCKIASPARRFIMQAVVVVQSIIVRPILPRDSAV